MPKRIVDGDALWVSEKLLTVPEKYRAEYAWVLPMTQPNGCFECSPHLIWREAYAMTRPGWTPDDVAAMLTAFEQAKMLFRFEREGKTYGMFVGIQKEGRLPKPSDRLRSAKPWQTGMVPADELADFLDVPVERIAAEYRDLLAEIPRSYRGGSADTPPTGIGVGLGEGIGNGIGEGCIHSHAHSPNENNEQTSKLSTIDLNRNKTTSASPKAAEAGSSPAETPPTHAPSPHDIPADVILSGSELDEVADTMAETWHRLMESNPHANPDLYPKDWPTAWSAPFRDLLRTRTVHQVMALLIASQTKRQQKFYVRPAVVQSRANDLEQDVARLKKSPRVWDAMLREYEAKLTKLPLGEPTTSFNIEEDDLCHICGKSLDPEELDSCECKRPSTGSFMNVPAPATPELADIRDWNENRFGINGERLQNCIVYQLDHAANDYYRKNAITVASMNREVFVTMLNNSTPPGWTPDNDTTKKRPKAKEPAVKSRWEPKEEL